jgi:hypothetical protein
VAWPLCRLILVGGMAFVSSYISGWHGIWVVLNKWMAWPLDHRILVDGMVLGRLTVVDGMALGRLRVVDGMAFGSSYISGWHGIWVVLQ